MECWGLLLYILKDILYLCFYAKNWCHTSMLLIICSRINYIEWFHCSSCFYFTKTCLFDLNDAQSFHFPFTVATSVFPCVNISLNLVWNGSSKSSKTLRQFLLDTWTSLNTIFLYQSIITFIGMQTRGPLSNICWELTSNGFDRLPTSSEY